MDEQRRLAYEGQSQHLRAALKKWEGDWAKAHGGSKPARGDIKQNPDIAHKYKQYNRIRDILAGKAAAPSPEDDHARRKRKSTEAVKATASNETPSKRTKLAQTPSKAQGFAQDIPDAVTPSLSRKLFSPSVPTSIGPTPQKDGRVLGLFDLLARTPSRSAGDGTVLGHAPKTLSTPSKPPAAHPDLASGAKLSRTPVSSGKRAMLDGFMTPLHRRDGNACASPEGVRTPASLSVSKLQFATPAFLRRTNTAPLAAVDENGEWKVEPIRLPRKPHGRSLSSVVASLRCMEEEAMDAELDVMREVEMEAAGLAPGDWTREKPSAEASTSQADTGAGAAVTNLDTASASAAIEVEDSQPRPALLGAFDDEALYDSPDEAQLGRNGQPLRVFNKKGPKRTTRKANIKPTRLRRPAQPRHEPDYSAGRDDEVVPETQRIDPPPEPSDPLDLSSDFEFEASETEDGGGGAHTGEKKATGQRRKKEKKEKGKKENLVQKALRKVSATAHANFRRLKLRNNGAKGGPGYNSRFRRRR